MLDNSTLPSAALLQLTITHVCQALFVETVGTTAVLGNLFLILLIWKSKELRQNDCIYRIALLASCDAILGLGNVVYGFGIIYLRTLDYLPNRFQCIVFSVLLTGGIAISQLATVAIAEDRLTAVTNVKKYYQRDHLKSTAYWMSASAVVFVVVLSMPFVNVHLSSVPPVCNLGGAVRLYYLNLLIGFSVIIGMVVATMHGFSFYAINIKYARLETGAMKQAIDRQRRVSRSISIILATYFICWITPTVGITLVHRFGQGTPMAAGQLSPYIAFGAGVNSALNVFIYGFKHRQIRAHMSRFFCGDRNKVAPGRTSVVNVNSRHVLSTEV